MMKPYQNWDIIQYQLVRRMYFINFHRQCDDEKIPTQSIFSSIYDPSFFFIILIPTGEALLDG